MREFGEIRFEFLNFLQSTVDLLQGPHWLNDQIILFYYEYLGHTKYAMHSEHLLFVPPPLTQLLKMSKPQEVMSLELLSPLDPKDKKLIFFAVNNNTSSSAGGAHWSLLVFAKGEDAFFSFDSMNNLNITATRKLIKNLKLCLDCPSADLYINRSAQQSNEFDCGIHLLANTENICDHFLNSGNVAEVTAIDPSTVDRKRDEILDLIKGLGGIF